MAFCEKCGAKISDNAVFCPGCGNKIEKKEEVAAQSVAVETTTGHKSGFRLREVSAESMAQAGINETVFANRVESVDDLKLNDCLFTLYKKLISPVSKIEHLTIAIQNNECEIAAKKAYEGETPSGSEYLSRFFISLFVAPVVTIFAALILGVIGLIFGAELTSSFCWLLYWLSLILLTIVPLKIKYRKISRTTMSRYNNHDIPILENEIKDYENQRNKIVLAIKDYICYCPPAYRHSSALSYFVDSYTNTRVNNLQEAVRAFDEHKRSQDVLNAMKCIYSVLEDIRAEQIRTNEQLASLQASVWAANFIF
ncbi:zinc-ribbon domain-containing protein [Butyrivibrio fibrisolvens DSM 3071]|uniref:Zinc-ribbon domain-containing protein n=1 Tax=Butyrivibrio fibrisolvens DSM 3071 TaxID=1121131 RepID=A0A1M5QK24_BUTFI|nr:zinc ribbon domain-containing protein [Butyrivibrio fibrisolvens]SHH14129.1 zinc-ribbon domain-containing protein [Butyrivibrio fibrisolvens DSM 3071]